MLTGSALVVSACGVSHLVITRTPVVPGAAIGTWTFSWPGNTAKIGARWVPKTTQTPTRLVGSLPSTRSSPPTCRAVPSGANLVPKIETMAFCTIPVTGGVLSPAPTTPPAEMCGAVGETAAGAVAVNAKLVTPEAPAGIVSAPALLPRGTITLADPSGYVMAFS